MATVEDPEWWKRMVRLAQSRGVDGEDVVQDVILRMIANGHGLEHSPEYWAVSVRNECNNYHRKRVRRRKYVAPWVEGTDEVEAHDSTEIPPLPPVLFKAEVRWLLAYAEKKPKTGAEKAKAFRLRRKIRKRWLA